MPSEVVGECDTIEADEPMGTLLDVLDVPIVEDFASGVSREAAYQQQRWGTESDAGKTPADWFWLIGYLADKALAAHIAGNREKALHHTISTAAACANWHAAIRGADARIRPGIGDR